MLLAFLAFFSAQAVPAPPAGVTIPEGRALHDAIAARSAEFFTLYHEGCDPERLRSILMPDFEMYHDQNGVSASSAEPFIAKYAERCLKRTDPASGRIRRHLLPGTLKIYPVPGYGAIEEGSHEHYGRLGRRPERKVTSARYIGLWKLTPAGWRLARAFSYDHVDAPRLPPIKAVPQGGGAPEKRDQALHIDAMR